MAAFAFIAPAPDFRYVGLEPTSLPIPRRTAHLSATAVGLGGSVAVALYGLHGGDARHALVSGVVAALLSGLSLRRVVPKVKAAPRSARMAIVPWGVLVHAEEMPRILRWSAVRRIEVATSSLKRTRGESASSLVVVETAHDLFEGETKGIASLEKLAEHVDAYAYEQSRPLALDLDGTVPLDALEPECESLLVGAKAWLGSSSAVHRLGLEPSGYRVNGAPIKTPTAIAELRRVLRDRATKAADPRAFAAVLAADLRVTELAPEIVALTQSPHPLVAAIAKQAARKLGVPRARTGTLDEVASFFTWGSDRTSLEAWGASNSER